ncbi:MAG TPA: general stress protein [Actinomycetes bacterium]|nr:general stress protein [Actinomycetes bacterium]
MQNWDERRIDWRVIGSFPSYQEAQQAVDRLAAAQFPVRRLTVVARGLRLLDQRGNRPGYGWAALHGLLLGSPTAAILGVLAALTVLGEPLAAALTFAAWAALAGALVGVAIGAGVEALRVPRRRGRHSVLHADRYDLVADGEVADRARHLLEGLGDRDPGSG